MKTPLLFKWFLIAMLGSLIGPYAAMAKTPITMWISSQPGAVTPWAAQFEKKFNDEHPDIDLTFQVYPNTTQQREKLIVAIAGGVAPDVVYDACNIMTMWVNNGVAIPLDKYINSWPDRTDIMPDILQSLRFGGQTWGLPFSVWATGDVYNMNIFNENGVGRPKTWNEMVTAAKRMRKVGPDGKTKVISYNFVINDLGSFVETQLAMEHLDSTVIEVDGREAKLNTDQARQALTYLRDLSQAGNPGSTGTSDIKLMLNNEMAIYHNFNVNNLPGISDVAQSLEIARFVGPKLGKDLIQGNGGMFFITKASRYPDQAWQVIQAFMERGSLKGYLLAHGTVLPSRISMHADNDLRSRPMAKELMAVLSPPIVAYGSRHPYATDFRAQAGAYFKQAILLEKSIDEALIQAENIINKTVAEKMGPNK